MNRKMKEGDLIEFWDNVIYEVTCDLNIFSPPPGKPKTEYGVFMGYQDGEDRIKILHKGKLRGFLECCSKRNIVFAMFSQEMVT